MYSLPFTSPSDAQYREMSPDLPFHARCNDELGIDLSENHPNGIADKMSDNVAFAWIGQTWLGRDDRRQLVLWALLRGLNFSPTKAQLLTLSPSVNVVGTMMGMTFSICALGLSVGSPVAWWDHLGITNI